MTIKLFKKKETIIFSENTENTLQHPVFNVVRVMVIKEDFQS